MSKKKKKVGKSQPTQQQNMSPLQYIKSGRARKLPIYECCINTDWKEQGIGSIVVARQHTTGNITFGFFLVDIFCLGIKSCDIGFNRAFEEYEEFIESVNMRHDGLEKIDYVLAHNIIFGALAYAEDLGFKPHKDWSFAQMVLEEDTEDIELIELEFGRNGKPCFISGPYDSTNKIINTLKKSVGEGNFDVVLMDKGQDSYGNLYFNNTADDENDDNHDGTEEAEYEEIKS